MPITESAGSATIGTTEHSLPANAAYASGSPQTDDVWCQVWLDLNALAAGDEFELKVYEKINNGGTQRLVESRRYSGAQGKPIEVLPTLGFLHGWDVTLKKIAGTDRVIAWSLRKA